MTEAGMIIAGVIYMIPVATLIWKAATLASRVKNNEEDIKALQNRMDKDIDKLKEDVDDLKIAFARFEGKLDSLIPKKKDGD